MARRKPDGRRIKLFVSLIRQIRGKPLLEALHRLQDGDCAYDRQPCLLLLPTAANLATDSRILRGLQPRFATLDHVVPRHLGGTNKYTNLVMASSLKNGEKGCLAPLNQWVPAQRFSEAEINQMIKLVEDARYMLALKFAADRKLTRQAVIDKLIRRELNKLETGRNFKFYVDHLAMVA